MKKIFYDKIKNKEIVDVSGNKTLEQIKQEFGDVDYQIIEIEDKELYKIDNETLRKLTQEELDEIELQKKNNQIKKLKDSIIKLEIEKDKAQTLGYTDIVNDKQIEINNLQTLLNDLEGE